ncbi:MAG: IMP dehydrogenase [Elusimicrobia bacterium CG_4_10_14_0_2_um_filter_56_8]|nr:MAG: IMP dehydrogenase [Elusimicrobia bacterium CG1_02_56_21]PJA11923.1 MAG: IMP dehydrogenase [Elusimicrobia bacterium CG_4_10_14_0_2_um_filter_56_8]
MLQDNIPLGLTFDDVLLLPAKSSVLPKQTGIQTRLTAGIALNIPLISAAMDTVTESGLAIAMAREGGLGIIHRAMPARQQAAEIAKVKKHESGVITNPITISPGETLRDALELMRKHNISGLVVISGGKLTGMLTNRDLRFVKDRDQKVSSVMTKKLFVAPVGTTAERAEALLHEHRIEKLPLVDRNYHLKGLITTRDIMNKKQYPNACKDKAGRLRVGAAIGAGDAAIERAGELVAAGVDVIALDTAHGHSASVLRTLKAVKSRYKIEVIAGNVATYEGALDLIKAGADAIKVGIGPGSICTTRIISGVGVPQLTAIKECRRAADPRRIPVIADGGIKFSGDITKAIAAGADCVMLGTLLAGSREAPGDIILYHGRSYKAYRGMGSVGAMEAGSKDRYGQAGVEKEKLVPEGIEGQVPYKGSVSDIVHQLTGGLRSGLGYCGCRDLAELRKKARFVRISGAGLKESHVHDVKVTKQTPNYAFDE